jgi:ketosteroid isomerase-like protein
MSEENVEIVRRQLDAYLRGDSETALAAYDPEVELDVSIRPEGRIYQGLEGLVEAIRTWSGTWEDYRVEVQEIIDAGDNVVVVDHQMGRGKGSGAPLDQQTFWVYTLREGKIVRLVWLSTREEALEAAGLSE